MGVVDNFVNLRNCGIFIGILDDTEKGLSLSCSPTATRKNHIALSGDAGTLNGAFMMAVSKFMRMAAHSGCKVAASSGQY